MSQNLDQRPKKPKGLKATKEDIRTLTRILGKTPSLKRSRASKEITATANRARGGGVEVDLKKTRDGSFRAVAK